MLAADLHVSIVGIDHMGKDENRKAVHRSLGSVGIVALVRSAWAVVKHPAFESRNLLLPLKSNLSKCRGGLAYEVVASPDDPDQPMVRWHDGAVNLTVDDVLCQRPARKSKVDVAAEFLRDTLSGGPVRTTELEALAKQRGISVASLRRASERLRITKRNRELSGEWYWQLDSSTA